METFAICVKIEGPATHESVKASFANKLKEIAKTIPGLHLHADWIVVGSTYSFRLGGYQDGRLGLAYGKGVCDIKPENLDEHLKKMADTIKWLHSEGRLIPEVLPLTRFFGVCYDD